MKKLLFLAVVLVVVCSSLTFAFDPMGPPCAQLQQDQWGYGVDYSYSDMDVHRLRKSWSDASKRSDLEMHKIGAIIGYGPSDRWDVFGRIGAIVAPEYDRGTYQGHWNGDGDTGFYLGAGMRATIWQQTPNLCWGGLAQYSWNTFDGTMKGSGYYEGDKRSFYMDLSEIQLAAGPCWTATEGVNIYGGPCYLFNRGYYTERDGSYKYPKALYQMDSFGAYVGAQFDLGNNRTISAEWITTGDSDALAITLLCRR